MDIKRTIKETLKERPPRVIENPNKSLTNAAVLIPIFKKKGAYEVLFTERSHKVEHHKGQISFPGGMFETHDKSLEQTALRETYEEVGIEQNDVEILGRLDDELTVVSGFIIHPFVGVFPYPYNFTLNKNEVERIISVPFSLFYPENSHQHLNSIEFPEFTYKGPAYVYDDVTIWGATAKIMNRFINILNGNLNLPDQGE